MRGYEELIKFQRSFCLSINFYRFLTVEKREFRALSGCSNRFYKYDEYFWKYLMLYSTMPNIKTVC